MTDETEIQPDADSEITEADEEATATDAAAEAEDDSSDTSDDAVAPHVVSLPVDADGIPENGEWRQHNATARFGFDERRVGRFQP